MVLAIAALCGTLLVDGSVRAEARGGTSAGGQEPNSAGVSADLQARLPDPDGALRFGLSPSAVLAQGRQLFVRGFGQADLRLGATTWARLRQAVGYGSVDLSPVAPGAGPGPVQLPAGTRFVSVEESSTSLELESAGSRRLRWGGSAAYTVTGGSDTAARAAFPLSRGPRLRAFCDWSATRLDAMRWELQGSDVRYSNGQRATLATLTAGWRTQTARGTELSISLGPGVGRSQGADHPATTVAYGAGAAEVRTAPARDLAAGLGISVEPLGDPLSGELVERASLRASAGWGRRGGVALGARVIGSMALTSGSGLPTSPRAGDRYLYGELDATVPLDVRSSLIAGLRAAVLSRPLLDQPADQWVAFVAYTAQLPLVR